MATIVFGPSNQPRRHSNFPTKSNIRAASWIQKGAGDPTDWAWSYRTGQQFDRGPGQAAKKVTARPFQKSPDLPFAESRGVFWFRPSVVNARCPTLALSQGPPWRQRPVFNSSPQRAAVPSATGVDATIFRISSGRRLWMVLAAADSLLCSTVTFQILVQMQTGTSLLTAEIECRLAGVEGFMAATANRIPARLKLHLPYLFMGTLFPHKRHWILFLFRLMRPPPYITVRDRLTTTPTPTKAAYPFRMRSKRFVTALSFSPFNGNSPMTSSVQPFTCFYCAPLSSWLWALTSRAALTLHLVLPK